MRTALLMLALAALGGLAGSAAAVPRLPATGPLAGSAAASGPEPEIGVLPAPAQPVAAPTPHRVAGSFVSPVPPPPVVLTPFRPPEHPYGSGHRGVDLAAPAGTEIRAAGSGQVVYAGMLAGRGVVSIQHPGGLRTTYEPVTASVSAGQHVERGQVIGVLVAGHPSCAPADCLHWGARLPDGTYLDPMSLLHAWQVRLKPWDPPP